MHRNPLGGMMDGEGESLSGMSRELFLNLLFISDKDDFDIELSGGQNGPLHNRGGGVISSHRIQRNLHKVQPGTIRLHYGWPLLPLG